MEVENNMVEKTLKITLNVNGINYEVGLEGNERLIDVLRDKLGFKSIKEGCGSGDCGVCIVLVDGKPIHSCLMMAFQARGKKITTVEGIGDENNLHPLQQKFIELGAVQCGYCIPAAILVGKYLIDNYLSLTSYDIRRELRSVLCRCGSYIRMEKSILEAARRENGGKTT